MGGASDQTARAAALSGAVKGSINLMVRNGQMQQF